MERAKLLELLSSAKSISSVIVCGLGITGIETALWLRRERLNVICVERLTRAQYEEKDKYFKIKELEQAGVTLAFGIDGEAVTGVLEKSAVSLCVLSPGINLASSLVGALKRAAIPCVTELELGVLCAAVPTIMVTGSNGKSTTVTLIHALLLAAGKRALLCGNVGVPVVAEFRKLELASGLGARFDWLVVEASSYQLEACESLAPDIGVILNLADNHLERHGTMQRYREAKLSMVLRQSAQQSVIINRDDKLLAEVTARLPGKLYTFGYSVLPQTEEGSTIAGAQVTLNFTSLGSVKDYKIDCSQLKLFGAHNLENIAAALMVLAVAGIGFQRDLQKISQALSAFTPLEHRLEFVVNINEASILNDSKSTTVAATVAAIKAVLSDAAHSAGKLILCVGGAAKTGSWQPLINELKNTERRIKAVLCFGQDGPMIADHLRSALSAEPTYEVHITPSVASAVEMAIFKLQPRDVLLFSPGCASFDAFSDFEHRGRSFKQEIRKYVENC